ncbi:putative Clavaminate synthase [Thiomonas arsenitoxydans]|jgi:hypothetical protein|uniref:Clavaminate synthase n=1 Tax=Thiomonas arsenitoxydans (strain DSM 22701 / CIP 110005 / 3As) TaxID=426114 RepID=D6CSY4_THIA3|nr:TauD/TfdA family dioxygenase [Thiomonas arsenitoxydans]CAZ88403.1 putative Clavaminate synthase [Thiomonas arsenitoxydans]CQR33498.1 putative Clavaminate synthase [Thiomonas arsenitoxydans]CQR33770.1 putative Clavaminate synthase [Thiomonas arsenitoxydans]
MSIMLCDAHETKDLTKDLKVVLVEHSHPSAYLEDFRARLANRSHAADSVGQVGADWLNSVLSHDAIKAVRDFTRSCHKTLLLRGIALSTDVSTPRDGFLPDNQCVLDFDLLHFGMLRLMGIRPYAVEYENHGKLVRNVLPVPEASGITSSWGADVDFSWHTDNPNWPFAGQACDVEVRVPNFLAFVAVRNHEGASTDVVCVDQILEQLPDWVITELSRPAYAFGAPASNEGFEGQKRIFPILEHDGLVNRMRFDEGVVEAVDPLSAEALSILRRCLKGTQGEQIVLRPGDFFIFKNTQVLHRRRAFKPLPEGKARWLRRVYAS